jgi:hypothetical protein
MKTLDLSDTYPPAESFEDDDEPTVKVQVPNFLPHVRVDEEEDNRDTIPSPPPIHEEKTYPGVGLLIALGFGLIFWSMVSYFIFR